jgi:hypothetical protein
VSEAPVRHGSLREEAQHATLTVGKIAVHELRAAVKISLPIGRALTRDAVCRRDGADTSGVKA